MPRIVWTPSARKTLAEIRDFISRDSPKTAESYLRRLMASSGRLRKHPYLGQVVSEIGREDVREILFGNYRIIYRVSKDLVEVVLVFHASRLLGEDNIDQVT